MLRALMRAGSIRQRLSSGRAFRPRLRHEPDAPELLLSPHWDDAVLSCWGVLTGSRELEVVNVFAGLPPAGAAGRWEAVGGVADSRERARARMAEDELALALASRRPRNLPLLDASFRKRPPDLDLQELDAALAGELTGAARVYAPAGIGAHTDHVLTRRYGRALLAQGMPVELYAELPYAVFHGWPSWVDRAPAEPGRDVEAYWRSFLNGVPEIGALEEGVVSGLDAPAWQAKLEALGHYRLSVNYAVKRMLADERLGGFEVRWRLHGADA